MNFFFFAHIYFPASGLAVVTDVVPSSPRLPSIFIAHRVQQIPLLVDFSSSVADSRSHAFRKSNCAQEKVPTNFMKSISRMSAVSSTNFRSILIFASLVVGTCNMCMYICKCDFFFPSGTSLRARTFVLNVGWGGHNSTVGLTLPEVWARSVQCVARGKPFKLFWP